MKIPCIPYGNTYMSDKGRISQWVQQTLNKIWNLINECLTSNFICQDCQTNVPWFAMYWYLQDCFQNSSQDITTIWAYKTITKITEVSRNTKIRLNHITFKNCLLLPLLPYDVIITWNTVTANITDRLILPKDKFYNSDSKLRIFLTFVKSI